jgi:hypothetical protein
VCSAGMAGTALGEVVALLLGIEGGGIGWREAALTLGGGGSGAMPKTFLSLAAAAAAAEAYFNISPGALIGNGAGFMFVFAEPFDGLGNGVCKVARAGKGDLSWFDGLRADAIGTSVEEDVFDFPTPRLPGRPSPVSGMSSCIDCVSCDDTRSTSLFTPQTPSSGSRLRSS